MLCPRCEQGVAIEVEVRATKEILHLCQEGEALWFNIGDIGEVPVLDFAPT